MTHTKYNNNHTAFMYKYKQSTTWDKKRLASKDNRRDEHDTLHETDRNRIKRYSFKSKKLTIPACVRSPGLVRRNSKVLRKLILDTVINNMKQDISTPGGHLNNVADAVTSNGAENQYYGRNVTEEQLKELFPDKNFTDLLSEGYCFRYGYATGSGQSSIGKLADYNYIYQLTDDMEQLLALDKYLLSLSEIDGIDANTNFNAISVKLYYYYDGRTSMLETC